ncbi:ABC transporter substrate-binding protein [Haloarcula amylovorans]|uniref:ABC transporter substrate-binding protein n=1 Tax=Haloarcula amylovorans TaxID=2562280 RepID=UPI0010767A36|nr:ABC transporter substrate-binding protein [Halomicroarcula amylolytica]
MVEHNARLGRRTVLTGLGAGMASLAGCSTIASDSSENEIRIGTIHPPMELDPIVATDVGSLQTIARVFDGLYTYDDGTDVVPQIATGTPSVADDGRRITVELDAAARFQNGEPVTASDVQYSFEAPQKEDTPSQWLVSPIETVDTVDEQTVRFQLEQPYPAFEHALTYPIIPKDVRETDREGFASDPIGAGPYRVRSFSEEKKADLTRWENYWGEPAPALDRVTFAYVESPITQLMGLVTGQSDVIEPISPRFRRDITDITDAMIAERPGFRSFYFGFNCNEGPTVERAVREGIVRCIDLEKLVEQFVEPVGSRQYSLLPRDVADEWNLPVEKWAAAVPPKDINEAKARFEEAPVSVGKLTILTSKHPVWKELAYALAAGLREAGQSVLVNPVSWKKYLELSVTGSAKNYAVFVGEIAGNGDPDSFLYPVFHENTQGGTNGIFYNEEDVMSQLLEARQTTDRDRRRARYEAAITRLHEEQVYVPVCSFKNSFAHKSNLKNFRVHPIAGLNPRVTRPDGAISVEGR